MPKRSYPMTFNPHLDFRNIGRLARSLRPSCGSDLRAFFRERARLRNLRAVRGVLITIPFAEPNEVALGDLVLVYLDESQEAPLFSLEECLVRSCYYEHTPPPLSTDQVMIGRPRWDPIGWQLCLPMVIFYGALIPAKT